MLELVDLELGDYGGGGDRCGQTFLRQCDCRVGLSVAAAAAAAAGAALDGEPGDGEHLVSLEREN